MRSLDVYMERQTRDRGIDHHYLSREINGITVRDWMEHTKSLSTHDKESIATASLMLGSSFFMFGLGAVFAFLDNSDSRWQKEFLDRELNQQRRPLKASQDLNSIINSEAKVLTNMALPALMSMDMSTPRPLTTNKPMRTNLATKEQAVFSHQLRGNVNYRFLVADRSWLKAGLVLKQKAILQNTLESVNGLAKFSKVSSIIAQIERLDKQLKRLGC